MSLELKILLKVLTNWAVWTTNTPFPLTTNMYSVIIYFSGAPSSIIVQNTFMIGHIVKVEWKNARSI